VARLPRAARLHALHHVDHVRGDVVIVPQRLRDALACARGQVLTAIEHLGNRRKCSLCFIGLRTSARCVLTRTPSYVC
jgi:hypothetical protein